MRGPAFLVAALTVLSMVPFAPRPVHAGCLQCDPFLKCVPGAPGARYCFESLGTCTMLLPCGGAASLEDDPASAPLVAPGDQLTTLTLFDLAPGAMRPLAMRRAGGTALALGDEARGEDGDERAERGLLEAIVVHGRNPDAVFVDANGDGFAFRRVVEPGGVTVELCDVRSRVVGAVLVRETLGEHDRVTVPVRVEGRDRLLVLQTRDGHGEGGEGELRRLRRTLEGARRQSPPRETPLLRVMARE